MKNVVTVRAALLAAVVLSLSVCKKPSVGKPPEAPAAPSGVASGGRATDYRFFATAVDPDSDSVCLRFQWGDGNTSNWSDLVASGETVSMTHAWSDSGTYAVKAQAKDETGSTSDWSTPLAVRIAYDRAPATPAAPSGPSSRPKDSTCSFSTIATDPDGDGVSYRFSWGNGDTSDWTSWFQSGEPGAAKYVYLRSGTYQVCAQARDVNEVLSPWSNPLAVSIANPYRPYVTFPINGPTEVRPSQVSVFVAVVSDSGGDSVSLRYSWGDGDTSDWTDFRPSGGPHVGNHFWTQHGRFDVMVQAMDEESLTTDWLLATRVTVSLLKWRCDVGNYCVTAPAVSPDGTVFVGSDDRHLYAIGADGTVKWRYEADGQIVSSPALSDDSIVYFGSYDSCVYAVTVSGLSWWRHRTGGAVTSSPAIGSDGTIYIGSWDGNLYALNRGGVERWRYPTGNLIASSPAVAADGTIYFGSTDSFVYAVTPMGTTKWTYKANGIVSGSPSIGADGTVYIGSDDGRLRAFTATGSLKWYCQTSGAVVSSASLATDGTVYFCSGDGSLNALSPDGTVRWRFQAAGPAYSTPAVAADGTVYFTSFGPGGCLYAVNPDGTLKWRYDMVSTESPPAIAADGTVYVGCHDFFLYAFDCGSPLATSPWPKFHHDNRNTGRAGD